MLAGATMALGDAILIALIFNAGFMLGIVAERLDARQRPAQREPRRFPTRQHHYKLPPRPRR